MDTLLLNRGHVAELLGIDECINAVETTFGLYAEQRILPPKVLGLHCENGGLHIKAGSLTGERSYFVTKLNANFPGNPKQNGLPTIQGVIVVCDATNGRLLALMDSIEITILRTGAATGVAAKYLAPVNAKIATICGCGNQGRISARALMKVRKLEKLFAFDIDDDRRENFRQEFSGEVEVVPVRTDDLNAALHVSDIVVTCTPSKKP